MTNKNVNKNRVDQESRGVNLWLEDTSDGLDASLKIEEEQQRVVQSSDANINNANAVYRTSNDYIQRLHDNKIKQMAGVARVEAILNDGHISRENIPEPPKMSGREVKIIRSSRKKRVGEIATVNSDLLTDVPKTFDSTAEGQFNIPS